MGVFAPPNENADGCINATAHSLHFSAFADGANLLKRGLASITAAFALASCPASAVYVYPLPISLACALLFFMKLEYTVDMVMPGMEPRDAGFELTAWLHGFLAHHPLLNSIFAACNTAFVVFQMAYVAWTFFVDGRKQPVMATILMYTSRAFLGYSTQLPLPQDFLGSGLDFPVNNTSFFLFFSGHVAGSVIVSKDMRRTQRNRLGLCVDMLNLLQCLRLLGTRGHYTIDLAVGAAAGWACDLLITGECDGRQDSKKAIPNKSPDGCKS